MKGLLIYTISGLLLSTSISSAQNNEIKVGAEKNIETSISIYNNNLAFVKDTRRIDLNQGLSLIAFEGVAGSIKPETAMLSGSGITVLEQNYDYNLMTPQNLLEASVGKIVKTAVTNPETGKDNFDSAQIITTNYGTPVLKFSHGIETNFPGRIIYENLPESLRTKPTLVINLQNQNPGSQDLELAYLTGGISWKADYIAEIGNNNQLNLSGWVTLNNESGTDYKDAKVQLIAGSINQTSDAYPRAMRTKAYAGANMMMDMAMPEAAAMPAQESLGDYHLYTLPNQTTIKDKQSKQVTLMSKEGVKFTKEYLLRSPLYIGLSNSSEEFEKQKPNITFKLLNNKASNLGDPLPAGTIRFYEKDSSQNLQFIGESRINHSAVDEKIELQTGKAFDISVNGKITKNDIIGKDTREISIEVKFDNSKNEKSTIVFEQYINEGYTILSENIKSKNKNSKTLAWTLDLEPKESKTLTFSVRIFKK